MIELVDPKAIERAMNLKVRSSSIALVLSYTWFFLEPHTHIYLYTDGVVQVWPATVPNE